jgi:hypothetical protein
LWETILVEQLREAYQRAMDHARFLLSIERGGRPTTFNHYFNSNLQKKRSERLSDSLSNATVTFGASSERYVSMKTLHNAAVEKGNAEHICEDIVDALSSYYKVSRKRFVDAICQQVIYHFLLDGKKSPLKILDPDLVIGLNTEKLEVIAGEDMVSKHRREVLQWEVKSLEAAMKVLRG